MSTMRINRTHQLFLTMVRAGWFLAMLMVILKPITAFSTETDDDDERFRGKHHGIALSRYVEAVNQLVHQGPKDHPAVPASISGLLMERMRKAGASRPKYDPGLKWIGLGKRPSQAPLSPYLFSDLNQFFQSARDELVHQYHESAQDNPEGYPNDGSAEVTNKGQPGGQHDPIENLKFVPRSQESAVMPSKSLYNPSILWTGLGR